MTKKNESSEKRDELVHKLVSKAVERASTAFHKVLDLKIFDSLNEEELNLFWEEVQELTKRTKDWL